MNEYMVVIRYRDNTEQRLPACQNSEVAVPLNLTEVGEAILRAMRKRRVFLAIECENGVFILNKDEVRSISVYKLNPGGAGVHIETE